MDRVNSFLDASELRASMAGRVMTPNPETLENTVVSQGQELLEVAVTKTVVIEALVPEVDIDDVVIGKSIQANFYTDMSRDYVSAVESVVPVAEKSALGSVVVVKASLDNQDEKLIPGTTCVAQISGRRHPGAVVLYKRLQRVFK